MPNRLQLQRICRAQSFSQQVAPLLDDVEQHDLESQSVHVRVKDPNQELLRACLADSSARAWICRFHLRQTSA